jgi:hypothetical protein
MVSEPMMSRAIARRSGRRSIAITRPAPMIIALFCAISPTPPQPHTATVSPGLIAAKSAPM